MARTITIPERLAFEAMELFAEAAEEEREFARGWAWSFPDVANDYEQRADELEKRADHLRDALGIERDA